MSSDLLGGQLCDEQSVVGPPRVRPKALHKGRTHLLHDLHHAGVSASINGIARSIFNANCPSCSDATCAQIRLGARSLAEALLKSH